MREGPESLFHPPSDLRVNSHPPTPPILFPVSLERNASLSSWAVFLATPGPHLLIVDLQVRSLESDRNIQMLDTV